MSFNPPPFVPQKGFVLQKRLSHPGILFISGQFDLLLLDIEMPQINGMELAARVKKLLPKALIIFITSHMEYVLDAYELSVFRYIPKTDPGQRLSHALLDAAAMVEIQLRESYVIQNQNRLERVPLQNILYITHEGKNAVLVTDLPCTEEAKKPATGCAVPFNRYIVNWTGNSFSLLTEAAS